MIGQGVRLGGAILASAISLGLGLAVAVPSAEALVVVGYDYTVTGGLRFNGVTAPTLPADNQFDLFFSSNACSSYDNLITQITGNVPYDFASPQNCFSIRGISPAANLDPADPFAFIPGFSFDSSGFATVTQTPVLGGSSPQVPGPLSILGAGVAFGWARRLRCRTRTGA